MFRTDNLVLDFAVVSWSSCVRFLSCCFTRSINSLFKNSQKRSFWLRTAKRNSLKNSSAKNEWIAGMTTLRRRSPTGFVKVLRSIRGWDELAGAGGSMHSSVRALCWKGRTVLNATRRGPVKKVVKRSLDAGEVSLFNTRTRDDRSAASNCVCVCTIARPLPKPS